MTQTGLVIVAVFVGACSLVPRSVAITSASLVQGDEQRLSLGVDTCNADHRVDVEETATEVTVTVTARNDTSDDCQDGLEVRLREPLDGRSLIDGESGQLVHVAGDA